MKKKSVAGQFIKLAVLPLIILEVAILIISSVIYTNSMSGQVNKQLKSIAMTVLNTYDTMYPGDFFIIGKESFVLMKGEDVVNGEFQYIDSIKEDTGVDISIIYSDTRFLTTIHNDKGERIVGATIHALVKGHVLEQGEERFYTNSTIGEEKYYTYYRPIFNAEGKILGMIEAGVSADVVTDSIWATLQPIILASLIVIVLSVLMAVNFTRKFVQPLSKIEHFAAGVAKGNLSHKLDESVLVREDEIGSMGRSLTDMHNSIKSLVEEDALTGINNRGFGEMILKDILKKSPNSGAAYAIALGDIDFFKKVNDMYGHDCGDIILKNVARILNEGCSGKGFAIRWGGEEFMLVFYNNNLEGARVIVEDIMRDIRDYSSVYGDNIVKVTMTFGIVEGNGRSNLDELYKKADNLLYYGKINGRNMIVTPDMVEEEVEFGD